MQLPLEQQPLTMSVLRRGGPPSGHQRQPQLWVDCWWDQRDDRRHQLHRDHSCQLRLHAGNQLRGELGLLHHATSPAGSAGPVDVTITTSSATSATSFADQFSYLSLSRPPGFDTDVGAPAISGSASYANGVYTVNGAGIDIYGANDQFH